MPYTVNIYCTESATVPELSVYAHALGLEVAIQDAVSPDVHAMILGPELRAEALVSLCRATQTSESRVPIVLTESDQSLVGLAEQLGALVVASTRELLSSVQLNRFAKPLQDVHWETEKPQLLANTSAKLSLQGTTVVLEESKALLGDIADFDAVANRVLSSDTIPPGNEIWPASASNQKDAAIDLVFGPPRSLSDPASKAALRSYGACVREEELCSSPSRAASEATRMGYPVDLSMASPDIRLWDYPQLAVRNVDNASRAREAFRQLQDQAATINGAARVLGVTVSRAYPVRCRLYVVAKPLPNEGVGLEIGFADPHGKASQDVIRVFAPLSRATLEERVLELQGSSLLGPAVNVSTSATSSGAAILPAFLDEVERISRFCNDLREEIVRIRIDPLIVRCDNVVDIGEACIEVSDAFVRQLENEF